MHFKQIWHPAKNNNNLLCVWHISCLIHHQSEEGWALKTTGNVPQDRYGHGFQNFILNFMRRVLILFPLKPCNKVRVIICSKSQQLHEVAIFFISITPQANPLPGQVLDWCNNFHKHSSINLLLFCVLSRQELSNIFCCWGDSDNYVNRVLVTFRLLVALKCNSSIFPVCKSLRNKSVGSWFLQLSLLESCSTDVAQDIVVCFVVM